MGSLRVDVGAAVAACERMASGLESAARGDWRRRVLPGVIDHALLLADSVFELDSAPDDTSWAPVKKTSGEILEETLTMRSSLYADRGPYFPDGFYVEVGYSDEKARHHQYGTFRGGPISQKAREPFHRRHFVPQRGGFQAIRRSARFDFGIGVETVAEREHVPARPLLPIDGIEAPRWSELLEQSFGLGLENWMAEHLEI